MQFSATDDLFHKVVKCAAIVFHVQHNSVVSHVTKIVASISSP